MFNLILASSRVFLTLEVEGAMIVQNAGATCSVTHSSHCWRPEFSVTPLCEPQILEGDFVGWQSFNSPRVQPEFVPDCMLSHPSCHSHCHDKLQFTVGKDSMYSIVS